MLCFIVNNENQNPSLIEYLVKNSLKHEMGIPGCSDLSLKTCEYDGSLLFLIYESMRLLCTKINVIL